MLTTKCENTQCITKLNRLLHKTNIIKELTYV